MDKSESPVFARSESKAFDNVATEYTATKLPGALKLWVCTVCKVKTTKELK